MYILLGLIIIFTSSCAYQPILERDIVYTSAYIPVKINWNNSGFNILENGVSKQSGESVHRATFRFFPKDGSEPFERYLEGNVYDGEIEVPIGEYSVIVMNESHTDVYWEGSVTSGYESIVFENVDSYENFSAYVKTHTNNPAGYYLTEYVNDNYLFMQPPLRLATWSIDNFVVTQDMVDYSHQLLATRRTKGETEDIETKTLMKSVDEDMFYALTRDSIGDDNGVDMRSLTRDVTVVLKVKNLTSVGGVKGAVDGFVNKVNMRTGVGFREPKDKKMVQYFTLNGRTNWYDENGEYMGEGWQPTSGENKYKDYTGETSVTFLSFGRDIGLESNLEDGSGLYMLDFDFIYIDGALVDKGNTQFELDIDNDPTTPSVSTKLPIDVTKQVLDNAPLGSDVYKLGIDITISTFQLEYTSGDITVEDWGDDTVIPL